MNDYGYKKNCGEIILDVICAISIPSLVLTGILYLTNAHYVPPGNFGIDHWPSGNPTGNIRTEGLNITLNPFTHIEDVEAKKFSKEFYVNAISSDDVPILLGYNITGKLDPDQYSQLVLKVKPRVVKKGFGWAKNYNDPVLINFLEPQASAIIATYIHSKSYTEILSEGTQQISRNLESKLRPYTKTHYSLIESAKVTRIDNKVTNNNLNLNWGKQ